MELSKAVYSCVSNVQDITSAAAVARRSTIHGVSVGSQFKSSLQSLVNDFEATQHHCIWCIKPNLMKKANYFSAGEILMQLRCSGMMEVIRIRREEYGLREDHLSFYSRFSVFLSAKELGGDGGIGQLIGSSDFQTLESHVYRLAERSFQNFHTRPWLQKISVPQLISKKARL